MRTSSIGLSLAFFALTTCPAFAQLAPPRRASGGATLSTLPPGPAPIAVTVTGTPATADLSWQAPAGATSYDVYRSFGPNGVSTKLTPSPITATKFADRSGLDYRATYTYRVVAIFADGRYGSADVGFTPPKPQNPAWVRAGGSNGRVTVAWEPVPGVSGYSVAGIRENEFRVVPAGTTSVTYTDLPAGPKNFKVGSRYDPGNVTTPASEWTTASWAQASGPNHWLASSGTSSKSTPPSSSTPPPCACRSTGAFTAPSWKTITNRGASGSFAHPSDGTFTVTASATSNLGLVDLAVTHSGGVVGVSRPAAAWGTSPDNRFFVVVGSPQTNGGAPLTLYRVQGGKVFPTVVSTEVWPDGKWGFSSDASMLIVTREQQAPARFELEAFNLRASNPTVAVLRYDETGNTGNVVTTSPCGDRLMHFRWTQLANPVTGQAVIHARKEFGVSAPSRLTADATGTTTPTASVEAASATIPFAVRLTNARLTTNGQTTFPSLQCEAP